MGSVVLQWVSGGVDSFNIPAETAYISASILTPLFLASTSKVRAALWFEFEALGLRRFEGDFA